ncbi:DUF814 domain-containing protein [candidate division WOR-3 bacterium]|nr:DUF814 domain-containing protein [candidate division WOR-3 bacterium]
MDHGEDTDETVALLKTGRHFRKGEGPKLIVGRNEEENKELLKHSGKDRIILEVKGIGSPIGLLFSKVADANILSWAAAIVARYSDADEEKSVNVTWRQDGKEEAFSVETPTDSGIEPYRI